MKERLPPAWACDVVRKLEKNGLTQNALAAELNVTYQYISEILNGKKKPEKGRCTKAGVQEAVKRLIAKRKGGV